MTPKYVGFDDRDAVAREFEVGDGHRWDEKNFKVSDEFPSDADILFAQYDAEGYEGSAFVLFERGGKLYEVNGSHCSCFGLEGQWDPEETTWQALAIRKPSSWGLVGTPLPVIVEATIRVRQHDALAGV